MSESRFTAQNMRETADGLVDSNVADMISILVGHGNLKAVKGNQIVAMLRQAADAEEELAKAKRPDACPANPTNKMCYLPGEYCCDTVRYLQKENAKIKARLEAVVKECEKHVPSCRLEDCKCNPTDSEYCDENCHDEIIVNTAVTAILRVARGEVGSEGGRV